MKHILFIGDVQWPFQHDTALKAVLDFVRRFPWGPKDELWFLGDGLDFDMLSLKFLKDPARDALLQRDIDGFKAGVLKPLQRWGPERRLYLAGNHEHRIQAYLWHQAPKLSSLQGLKVEALLDLDHLGYEYHPYGEMVRVANDFYATHGNVVRAHAGFTAKVMLDKTGVSGIMGHTHRLGASIRRIMSPSGGTRCVGWWENGCLCDQSKMDWVVGVQDWQTGFSIGTFYDDGSFAIESIFIHEPGWFVWGGERYG